MEYYEIKKTLYRHKPIANFICIKKGVAYYDSIIKIEDDKGMLVSKTIFFAIPVSDMDDAVFDSQIQSQLLCKWITEDLGFLNS